MVSEWGMHLLRHFQILTALFLEHFLPDQITKLKHDHFYSGLSKWFKVMVACLKASSNEKTYSDDLQAAQEVEKEEAMEASHNLPTASTSKPRVMNLFPLQKLKGSQLAVTSSTQVAHLEEESANKEKKISMV